MVDKTYIRYPEIPNISTETNRTTISYNGLKATFQKKGRGFNITLHRLEQGLDGRVKQIPIILQENIQKNLRKINLRNPGARIYFLNIISNNFEWYRIDECNRLEKLIESNVINEKKYEDTETPEHTSHFDYELKREREIFSNEWRMILKYNIPEGISVNEYIEKHTKK